MKRLRTLAGKRVLITGAAGGIGSALARHLLVRGARLVLVDRDEQRLQKLRQRLGEEFPGSAADCELFVVDLTVGTELVALVDKLQPQGLDVLINNAGMVLVGAFAEMAPADIDTHLEVNLLAPLRLTRMLLPLLRGRGRAHIVNVASGAGLAAPAGLCAYATSKFGLVGFSEALRAELAGDGIGVSVVCPAFVKTDIVRNSSRGRDEDTGRVEELNGLVQRLGTSPERVAKKIVRAIEHNRARVVIGLWARPLVALRCFFPGLASRINQLVFSRMKKKGLLE
ncbi:MAG: acetoin dehydrogenase [Deltaproteobacteria bacterium]|nr:MAG: acetoin dehydrogenase [Deltaproteobacteria bacterium]